MNQRIVCFCGTLLLLASLAKATEKAPVWKEVGYALQSVSDISFLDDDNGWAFGADYMAHYDGQEWEVVATGNENGTRHFLMLNDTLGWEIGRAGELFRFRGRKGLDTIRVATTSDMNALHFCDPNNGWAVGDAGTILHWSGEAWTVQPSGTLNKLRDVHAVSPTEAYAVGDAGTVLKYDGTAWAPINVGQAPADFLMAVEFSEPGNGWIGGATGEMGELLLHYDGSNWSKTSGVGQIIFALAFSGPNHGCASLYPSGLAQWDGTTWTKLTLPSEVTEVLKKVEVTPNHLYFVFQRSIYQLTGTNWSMMSDLIPHDLRVKSVTGLPDGRTWFGCSAGVIIHYDTKTYTMGLVPDVKKTEIAGIAFLDDNTGYAISRESVLRHDRGVWYIMHTVEGENFEALSVTGPNRLYVGGSKGRVYAYDGTAWTIDTIPMQYVNQVHQLSMNDDDHGHALAGGEVWVFERSKQPQWTYLDGGRDDIEFPVFDWGLAAGSTAAMIMVYKNQEATIRRMEGFSATAFSCLDTTLTYALTYKASQWYNPLKEISRYENGVWTTEMTPVGHCVGLKMLAPDKGWAWGDNTLIRYAALSDSLPARLEPGVRDAVKASVYHNQTTNQVAIKLPTEALTEATLCDLSGKTLIRERIRGEGVVSVAALTKGVYILVLVNEQGRYTEKVMRQ